MKKFCAFAVAVATLLLLLPDHGQSIGHLVNQPHPAPKAVAAPKPVIVNHTPAPGHYIAPAPAKTPAYVAPKAVARVPNIEHKFPAEPVHVDQKAFVEANKNKFVGVGQKAIAAPHKEYAKVVPPQLKEKFVGQGHPVVAAFHDKIGKKPIVVAGKTYDPKMKRPEFTSNYEKHWSERIDQRHDRGGDVRDHLGASYHHLFTPDWWGHFRNVRTGWWGRYPAFASRWFAFRGGEWWHPAPWTTFVNWCVGPGYWATPFYYDYGGNVIFDNGVVYLDGQPIASQSDYAIQADQLADSGASQLDAAPPPPDQIQAQWLPLGAFAITTEDAGDPTMFLQLAVNKQGVLMGTLYNSATDQAQPVVGAIDPKTQRAAWYVGDNKTTVMETGAYNLSQSETQVLVHFGTDQTQTWMMVRMEEPPPK